MESRSSVVKSGVAIGVLLLVGLPVAAQNSKVNSSYLSSIEPCNGGGTTSLDARIAACTAFIEARQGTTAALAIAYNNRGNAYTAKGDFDKAIRDFDQSIALKPTYTKAFNNRGVAYLRKGEYQLAIEAFDDAIKLDPDYGAAFVNRAGAYLKKNDHQRAAHDYDEAIRLQPDSQAAWSGRCWTRALLGAWQAALEDCDRALQSGSTSAAVYDTRGLIHLRMGEFGAAIADYNSALRAAPELASALFGRGLAKLKQGDEARGEVHGADVGAVAELQHGRDQADHDRPEQLVDAVQGRVVDVADEEAEVQRGGEQYEEAEDNLLEIHAPPSRPGCRSPTRASPPGSGSARARRSRPRRPRLR